MKRTCDELGVCQDRATGRCAGCFPFAPGAIERYERQRDGLQRAGRAALVLIAVVALSALGGLLAGIARAKGWL